MQSLQATHNATHIYMDGNVRQHSARAIIDLNEQYGNDSRL